MNDGPRKILAPLISAVKEGKDALIEVANITLGTATNSEVFSKVPVFSAIVGVVGFCDAVMSIKLRRNTAAFLEQTGKVAPEKLDQLYEKVMGDPRFTDEVPDTLIQLLIDSYKPVKAEVVGRLFAALAEGKMEVEEFNDLVLIVIGASVPALMALPAFFEWNKGLSYKNGPGAIETEPLLLSIGLASRFGTSFRIDAKGILLYEAGFNGTVTDPR
ncbi:hypothetical protein LMG27952_07574 [Paraburkholderia hiiakae]|uniref:Uncharacterized protein n=1 Tax=Paraburkholderia hiiakae TaxID=1081782 RepID=A0ABN7IJR3_9BURK|nr:hypothetical protein [Paraburkholderia hiiakae]CAD6561793.1 hypothetical protein LMG27952_07574 [Paraburkholderia hiiakae]